MTEQELRNAMKGIVNTWWNNLTNDQKTALKLLKFSPSIVGSMFFFDADCGDGFAAGDYMDFRDALKNYGIGRDDYTAEINWRTYHAREKDCKKIEEDIRNNELICKLPADLREQVVDNLRRQDGYWSECWSTNIENLKKARKAMFWEAIEKLRKEVEG